MEMKIMYITYDIVPYIDYYSSLVNNNKLPKYYKSYLDHILEHKKLVYIAWIYIGDTLSELGFINKNDMCHIYDLIIEHDNSKLLKDEFYPYSRRFKGTKRRKSMVEDEFRCAVRKHKSRNLHHYESLQGYRGKFWKHYAVELICDYIAMGWQFNNYIYEYFQKVRNQLKTVLPKEYFDYIESIINIIPKKLSLAEEPLTENNIEYIWYRFNYYNDPFDDNQFCYEKKL